MVGYHPEQITLAQWKYGLAGATSGVVTRAIVQPLDVIKIRMQLQVEPLKRGASSKYYSLSQTLQSIVKEEGTTALWKGHMPAQVLSVAYGISQFIAFEALTKLVGQYLPENLTKDFRPITHMVCGGAAGCMATLTAQPFDVVRTRLVAQGEPKIYRNQTQAFKLIVTHEGGRALYKGLLPTLLAIGPHTGFQFGFYSMFTDISKFFSGKKQGDKTGPLTSLLCGAGAGLCAKTAVYPLDLCKKRLQVQGFEHARKKFGRTDRYSGFIHCVRTIVKEEGISALYKGLSASLLKAMVSSGCIFFTYEQCCNILILTHQKLSRQDR